MPCFIYNCNLIVIFIQEWFWTKKLHFHVLVCLVACCYLNLQIGKMPQYSSRADMRENRQVGIVFDFMVLNTYRIELLLLRRHSVRNRWIDERVLLFITVPFFISVLSVLDSIRSNTFQYLESGGRWNLVFFCETTDRNFSLNWRRSSVFIVNFEYNSHLDFEQVSVSWDIVSDLVLEEFPLLKFLALQITSTHSYVFKTLPNMAKCRFFRHRYMLGS